MAIRFLYGGVSNQQFKMDGGPKAEALEGADVVSQQM